MEYKLLWIEHLCLLLSFAALWIAAVGRRKRSKAKFFLAASIPTIPLFMHVLLLAALSNLLRNSNIINIKPPLIWIIASYTAALIFMLVLGFRSSRREPKKVKAASWPIMLLGVMLVAAAVSHAVTWRRLDQSIISELNDLQDEAAALAQSNAPQPVDDEDNAALVYRQAIEAFNRSPWPSEIEPKRILRNNGIVLSFQDPKFLEFMQSQETTINLLHQASHMPDCRFKSEYAPNSDSDEMGILLEMVNLLLFDMRFHMDRGEAQCAMKAVDTIFKMAEHVRQEPLHLATLIAGAIDRGGFAGLQFVLLNEDRSDKEALNIISIDLQESLPDVLKRSVQPQQAFVLNSFHEIYVTDKKLFCMMTGCSVPPTAKTQSCIRILLAQSDINSFHHTMDERNAIASKPYYESQEEWEQFDEKIRSEPLGIITWYTAGSNSIQVRKLAANDARRHIARTTLAVARYQRATGELPKLLHDMTPDYILEIPVDAFSGKPLKYRLTNDGTLIYSIGPNLVDDKGSDAPQNNHDDIVFELLN